MAAESAHTGRGAEPAKTLEPLSLQQQQQVRQATDACLQRASRLYRLRSAVVPVSFDLRGRAAGQYRVAQGRALIRFNPYIFARYLADSLSTTVPHEVAHYIVDRLYGLRNVRPHGTEWQGVMRRLGAEPRATAHYDLSGVPVRRQRRFDYQCACMTHSISSRRHNRIRRGEAVYLCRRCSTAIRYAGVHGIL